MSVGGIIEDAVNERISLCENIKSKENHVLYVNIETDFI